MRRRYIAALSVITPVVIIAIVNYFYPVSYDILFGYMLAIALVFKGALISFFMVSKLKIIAFLKGLTALKATILLLKRWLLDNVVSVWIKENIVVHIIKPFVNIFKYYRSLNFRRKIKNFFVPLVVMSSSLWLIYSSGYLDNILLFTELKVFIIGFSKTVLLIVSNLFGFVVNSWISPILEVFALSFLITKLEDWLGKDNSIVQGINWLGEGLNRVVSLFANNKKYINTILNKPVNKKSKEIGAMINNYINHKKSEYEYEQFERLETKILKGHIDAYYTFKGIEKIKDKKRLYSLINERTKDNLDIVAFVSRDRRGNLVSENLENSFYHDIFILEGVASSHTEGVKPQQKEKPDYSDFWILNSSNYPVWLVASDKYKKQLIEPKSVTFIKTKATIDYTKDKICFEFREKQECAVVLG